MTPVEYFFSRLWRIDFSMIGFTSVRTINSWRSRKRPATKSAASTFCADSCSLSSNSVSISSAVALEIVGSG